MNRRSKARDAQDIEIKIIGSRPGEKIYECLMTDEEAFYAENKKEMYVLRPKIITPHYIEKQAAKAPIALGEYNSKYAQLLLKEQIRKVLSQIPPKK